MLTSLAGIQQAEEGAAEAREKEASGGEASAEVHPEQRKPGPEPEPDGGRHFSTSSEHTEYIDWSMAKKIACCIFSCWWLMLSTVLHIVRLNSVTMDDWS